jgi:hypothetical protein
MSKWQAKKAKKIEAWKSGVDAMLVHICAPCFYKCGAHENEVLEFFFEARGLSRRGRHDDAGS